MDHFVRVQPGSPGAFLAEEEETTLLMIEEAITIMNGTTKWKPSTKYRAYLTSYRLILHGPELMGLDLSLVESYKTKSGSIFRPPTVTLNLRAAPEGHPSLFPSDRAGAISLLLNDPARKKAKKFEKSLKTALRAREWEKRAPAGPAAAAPVSMASMGITGILREKQLQKESRDQTMSEAFSDARSLMALAKELIGMSAQFKASLSTASAQEQQEFSSMMSNMGLASAVTKDIAGPSYIPELARELCGFLAAVMERAHAAILPIEECYGVYNRARGTDLVSPDDFYAAAAQFAALGMPLELRRYGAGMTVVQKTDFSPDRVSERLVALLADKEKALAERPGARARWAFLTPVQVADVLEVSLGLAELFLQQAEAAGFLCRDESTSGVVFFRNLLLAPAA
eukprot:gnl/Chilomastix_cuspidata/2402.p1 GENE.gnl/Chilomastix_cuspidata/2402~~gnl/Chilomastix_cuspidata/2402.p1  ORF type:complete len:438 (+),score=201.59 gnl/Chilomastix_cuspidata/2402:120-1316(+)